MRHHTSMFLGSLLLVAPPALPASAQQPPARADQPRAAVKESEFRSAMRELWAEHVVWTRQFIVSTAASLPDQSAATERLLKNHEDLGKAIKPFYGNEAGDRLTALLREHIAVAAEAVKAAKANQSAQLETAKQRWFAKADTIATFLSQANPQHWRRDDVRGLLREHLNLTLDEASARLKGDWKADIDTYDKVFDQAMRMADGLSDGIIRQYPNKFGRGVAN